MRPDHTVGHLLERPLPLGCAQGPPEVLLRQDVGGVDAPAARHFHAQLFEGDGAVAQFVMRASRRSQVTVS